MKKKPAKKPRKDVAQEALSVVERAIGGKLSNGTMTARNAEPNRRTVGGKH